MARRKAPKQPAVGADVIVEWLDSGLGTTGSLPEARQGRCAVLVINRTHGRVVSVGVCGELASRLPKGLDSTTLRLAMCCQGDGEKDDRVDLAAIWWPSVLSVRVWPEVT